MNKIKVKFLIGSDAGQIVEGIYICQYDSLDQMNDFQSFDWGKSDENARQAYSDLLNRLWAKNRNHMGVWIGGSRYAIGHDVEDMHAAYDRKENEINVGDVIVYAMRDLRVSQMKVSKIEYKDMNITMHGIDLFENRKTKNSYPRRCLKI